LGVQIPSEKQIAFLDRLGCVCQNSNAQGTEAVQTAFSIPSFRVDLKREADLIEEVGRMFGIENIPARAPGMTLGHNAFDAVYDQLALVRRILTGLGFAETQGQTLLPETAGRIVCPDLVCLQNPLSSDMNVLRPSLLPGLIDALRRNLSRKNEDLAMFEIGRVFLKTSNGASEERRVALALTGKRDYPFWSGEERDARYDIYDLKGALEELFEHLGVRGLAYARRDNAQGCFIESAAIQLGKQTLGEMGQLLPTLARQYDLRDPVYMVELNLDLLLARRVAGKSFKPLPAYPSIRRDIAMIVAESVTHDAVLSTIKQAKPQFLESVQLFDVFRGKNVPAGQKSVAYAFLYRHAEKTLTDAEVNSAHDKVVNALKQNLSATVREA
jgi:phenylalanyl-tRNA synthetase beta chain